MYLYVGRVQVGPLSGYLWLLGRRLYLKLGWRQATRTSWATCQTPPPTLAARLKRLIPRPVDVRKAAFALAKALAAAPPAKSSITASVYTDASSPSLLSSLLSALWAVGHVQASVEAASSIIISASHVRTFHRGLSLQRLAKYAAASGEEARADAPALRQRLSRAPPGEDHRHATLHQSRRGVPTPTSPQRRSREL
jgi:hypothetical protein